MGRWAQRRRGGGGGGPTVFIVMVDAHQTDTTELTVGYSAAVTAANFGAGDFTSQPSSTASVSVSQGDASHLVVDFGVDITGDTDVQYAGTVPNVQNPQDMAIT